MADNEYDSPAGDIDASDLKSEDEVDKLADDQVQEKVDRAEEKGFLGQEVDQTPNENYTVPGQLAGKPVPETDPDQAKKATGDHA